MFFCCYFYSSVCCWRWWRGARPWATSECFWKTQEVNSLFHITDPGASWRCVCVCVLPTVLCCWIQSWGHSDLSLLQPVPPISSAWSKTVTRPAFPRSDIKNQLFGFQHPWSLTLKNACRCRDVLSSTSFLALWDAVLPVPTHLRQRGWAFWTKRGRWSPKCAVLRCSRNTAVIVEMFVIGSRCLTWGLFCFYFRITSTVLKSGLSSHADTSQWESWTIKNRGAVTCFSDLNNSSLFFSQKREVNTILADIIKHMTPDRAFEDAYPQVSSTFAHAVFIQTRTLSSSHRLWFHSCSQPSGRSWNTSTTSLSSSP